MKRTPIARPLGVGSSIEILLGRSQTTGKIVENLGPLAPGGGIVFRVLIHSTPDFHIVATEKDLQAMMPTASVQATG